MIAHDLLPPVNQVRIDGYYFCLMLMLVTLQLKTSVLFVFNLKLCILLLLALFSNKSSS